MDWGIRSDAETGLYSEGVWIKLSDCPSIFRERFEKAREAIKKGHISTALREAVFSLKAPDVINQFEIPNEHLLDVCDETDGSYFMTLLAYAGYHFTPNNFDILNFLIEQDARVDMGTPRTGTPLLQMLVYAYHEQERNNLPKLPVHIDIVRFFLDNGAILSRILYAGDYNKSTALELGIVYQRFDICHLLVERGANPFLCGDGVVSPLLVEYACFGTHGFLQWLLDDYLTHSEIPATDFVSHLLETGVLFRNDMKNTLMEVYGRNPAHAFLLCGHEQTIKYLIQKKPELLGECDPFGKTALHLAVEEGDLDSVKILLNCNATVNAEDKSSTTPYMLAMVNGHTEVIELLKPYHIGTNNEMVWALRNGYPKFFEEMHETRESEEKLLEPLDGNKNTIAHLAAEDGNTSVFKVIFPNEHSDFSEQIFRILTTPNIHQKTPLHIVVEKGNIEMLDALHERRAKRSKNAAKDNIFQQQAERLEKVEWKKFWDEESEELLLYACRHGTVEIVDYFLRHSISPTTVIDSKTPLSCAAEEGKHDIVEYLLKKGVPPTGFAEGERYISGTFVASERKSYTTSIEVIPDEYHPLMLAAKRGHTNCVTLLLKEEANSLILSTRNYNCLMEAVSAGHRDVAVALLNHDPKWEDAMHHTVHGEKGAIITPFTMLIKEMPGVAKVALNKCLRLGTNSVTYNFGFLEHRKNQSDGNTSMPASLRQRFSSLYQSLKKKRAELLNHPLSVMVKHKRLELLQHPLVSRYIWFFWWRLFPFLFAYLLLYILFLVLLTVYAVVTPRPGPDNQYCPGNSNFSGNSTDDACFGLAKGDLRLFRALAVVIILLCIFFLLPQVIPVRIFLTRHTTSAVIALCIQFVTIILILIFVSGFGNDCWCTPSWQWQIGAMAVFLAYLLFILQLGGIPYIGVYIYMLVKIVLIFVQLVYLPFLLVLSFAIPFYMLFVRESGAQIEPFTNPARAIFKVIFQTVGQLDVGSLLESGDLLYTPFIEILFLAFVILMPLLFITMLVGLAVRTTEKDIENATFKGIDLRVEYILTAKIFEPLMKLLSLPKNLKVYVGSESPDSATDYMFLGVNKLRGVNCGELAQAMKKDDRTCKVVKENVTSVIGIKDSLLDYTDRGLQNIQSEIKGMRHTLEELQKRDKILSTLRSDIRTIKASNKSLLYLQSEVKSIRRVEKE